MRKGKEDETQDCRAKLRGRSRGGPIDLVRWVHPLLGGPNSTHGSTTATVEHASPTLQFPAMVFVCAIQRDAFPDPLRGPTSRTTTAIIKNVINRTADADVEKKALGHRSGRILDSGCLCLSAGSPTLQTSIRHMFSSKRLYIQSTRRGSTDPKTKLLGRDPGGPTPPPRDPRIKNL